jgi:hypothetical protein
MNLHLQPLQVATDSSDQEWKFGHFENVSGFYIRAIWDHGKLYRRSDPSDALVRAVRRKPNARSCQACAAT